MKKQLLATCGLAFALSVGSALAQTSEMTITIAPPPSPQEEIPTPPVEHTNWVWHPGYYRWDNGSYVWVKGEYVARPDDRPQAVWVAGNWEHRGNSYVWVEGHWR